MPTKGVSEMTNAPVLSLTDEMVAEIEAIIGSSDALYMGVSRTYLLALLTERESLKSRLEIIEEELTGANEGYESCRATVDSMKSSYEAMRLCLFKSDTLLSDARKENESLKRDAERYRWLRNPSQDISLVLDKVVEEKPVDRFGCGGYPIYEYRSGDELDNAIDTAMQEQSE